MSKRLLRAVFFAFRPSETFLSDGLSLLSSTECHIIPNIR
ncbi:hypothetical protein NEIFL0001_2164 [Neisseria flavescens SK114]|nr:hypothetical protein NEIFL0001_2164 [Neisseria flavescens SK114]